MPECDLAVTGANTELLVVLALLLLGTGVVLLLAGRRRGVGHVVSVVVALAVGATALLVGDAPRADAACASTTTVAPTTTASTSGTSTTSPTTTTTAAPTTSTTSTPATTTTTTTSTTTTSTSTVPVPDLTASIVGPTTGLSGDYTISITNVGSAPTTGSMTFTLDVTVLDGSGVPTDTLGQSDEWEAAGAGLGSTFQSFFGLVIAPGATSVVTVHYEWRGQVPGSWRGTVDLPTGIGGETNSSNNTDSITVEVPPAA